MLTAASTHRWGPVFAMVKILDNTLMISLVCRFSESAKNGGSSLVLPRIGKRRPLGHSANKIGRHQSFIVARTPACTSSLLA